MYALNVSWIGGPRWDNTAPSSFNPSKKKSATEHLIETGGQTIEEAIEGFDKFKDLPIKVNQWKPEDDSANWITQLVVEENDPEKAEKIKEILMDTYVSKQKQLESESNTSGYRIQIELLENVNM